MCEEKEIT